MNKTPARVFNRIFDRYRRGLFVFAIVYAIGLLCHLFVYTNKLFNFFELGNIFADMSFYQGDTIAQGRWFMPIGTNLTGIFSAPVINGLLSLLYMSLSAVMIADVIALSSAVYRVLFGAAFVTFPGYACIMAYGVNSDSICLGVLLCTFGGWLYYRLKGPFRYIWPIISIGCGLGLYQTYLTLPMAMIYSVLLIDAARRSTRLKPFLTEVLKAGLMLAGAFIFYYVMLKLFCLAYGVALTDYHGVDSMTSFTPRGIVKGLVFSYLYFLSYFFTKNYVYTIPAIAFNTVGALAFLVMFIRLAFRRKIRDGAVSTARKILLLGLLPLGINGTPFLMADRVGAGVDRYMLPSLMVLWGLLLRLLEVSEEGDKESQNPGDITISSYWLAILSVTATVVSSFIICNEAYHRLDAATITTQSYLNRIAVRLEQMEEYRSGMPVYFANAKPLLGDTYDVELPAYEAVLNMPGTELAPHYNERGVARYFRTYLHMPIPDAGEEAKLRIDASKEFAALPAYPDEGAIAVMDKVIVVKLTEHPDSDY